MLYDTKEPVAALATPWGESALAVIRTSGEGAVELFARVFSSPEKVLASRGYTLHFGYLTDPESGSKVDQITAAVYKAPKSYTGQDSVEIFCHGSLPGIESIMNLLRNNGFRNAAPGEFTLRAFLNGKMDLSQAEAVAEIVDSKSVQAHNLALNRLAGAVFQRIDAVKKKLALLMGTIEVQLDYPDDEIGGETDIPFTPAVEARDDVKKLLDTFAVGRIYREGITVALAGRTNAGKSSLFNLFLREDRSIVSDISGTTRDYIESWITIKGIPVRLFDTAGLREAEHPVEKEGIRRSNEIISDSSIVLYVLDGERGVLPEDERVLAEYGEGEKGKYIFVWNKSDAAGGSAAEGSIPVSALTGDGFQALEEAVFDRIVGAKSSSGEVMIDSLRQKNLLESAYRALGEVIKGMEEGVSLDGIAMDLKEAMDCLGEITGEVTSNDILKNIFSNFCVGK